MIAVKFPLVFLIVIMLLNACGGSSNTIAAQPEPPPAQPPIVDVDDDGNTTVDTSALEQTLLSYSKDTVDDQEEADLLFMREEEKLAQDVYLAFANLHGLPVFTNIAESEATHTAAIKVLLERYDLDDPAAQTSMGEFSSSVLQTLYDDLTDMGTPTLVDALMVGVLIEELDIADLTRAIERLTNNADIALVYANLQKGSRNHLRAFYARLVDQGGQYVPQYITQDEFDAIVESPVERGPD